MEWCSRELRTIRILRLPWCNLGAAAEGVGAASLRRFPSMARRWFTQQWRVESFNKSSSTLNFDPTTGMQVYCLIERAKLEYLWLLCACSASVNLTLRHDRCARAMRLVLLRLQCDWCACAVRLLCTCNAIGVTQAAVRLVCMCSAFAMHMQCR